MIPATAPITTLPHPDRFVDRHIGPDDEGIATMLATVGHPTLEAFIGAVVPPAIRSTTPLAVPAALSESQAMSRLHAYSKQNQVFRSYLGLGYHDTITPPVIRRSLFENPGWYTQYTPYQAEISQGRLEGLLIFQTMVADLTGLPVANASLLDEATAAAEAMTLCRAAAPGRGTVLVADDVHPQTIAVVTTRAAVLGVTVLVVPFNALTPDAQVCGVLVQNPASDGQVRDLTGLSEKVHAAGGLLVCATDLLACCLLLPPGEQGVDVAVGNSQRFGVPLGFGGPHAAFMCAKETFRRQLPGRIVGVSKDAHGRPAMRLALQTREQHIRREKATSNICTAQALLANMAAMYAVYHGPQRLAAIASRVQRLAAALAAGALQLGHRVVHAAHFDTVRIRLVNSTAAAVLACAVTHRINLRAVSRDEIIIALDETSGEADVAELVSILNNDHAVAFAVADLIPAAPTVPVQRTTRFLTHPVFNRHHSETQLLRFLKHLENKDFSLAHGMIPLGSCTMKLNAAAEMFPVSYAGFSRIHPFAPADQTGGYRRLFADLEQWLCSATGFAACSLQPNAGSQGEYAGLLAIRGWHASCGQAGRRVCLIPTSAHGTNPATAAMAGMTVVAVACDVQGNIDLGDLRAKAAAHAVNLCCLMVTYPSTHGVFEEGIREACAIIHDAGGQVYMDGANMNAQVGLTSPGFIGADVCHLNLHKTFAIPHGGGGPGMGPICVQAHLKPFLPGHPVVDPGTGSSGAVSAAPWGSASILTISWAYIAMLGPVGLTRATEVAILAANYIAKRLEGAYPVLYRGRSGLVAHECIIDLRGFKAAHVEAEDVAKRLMDYGFHAPTLSFPVAGTLMIEPTESESVEELDRFCAAMLAIRAEIQAIADGSADPQDNLLKNAPHSQTHVCCDPWAHPYTREQAAFPAPWSRDAKFWPTVSRVDSAYGDRNPQCACPPVESYV